MVSPSAGMTIQSMITRRMRESVDLHAHKGKGRPAGERPGDTADGDEDGGEANGSDEGRKDHRGGEDEVGNGPGREQVGFVEFLEEARIVVWLGSSRGRLGFFLGTEDGKREGDGPEEGDEGEYDERERPDAADVAECVGGFGHMWSVGRIPEVGFTHPGGGIEEERKPADPRPELDPADRLYPGWQVPGGLEDLCE